MKIACFQYDTAWEDRDANLATVARMLDEMPSDTDMVILPELFAVGFTMNIDGVVEDAEGPTHEFLAREAGTRGIRIVGSAVHDQNGLGRNMALVYNSEGEHVCSYAKIHPFSYAGENEYYAEGTEITIFESKGMAFCPFVCYDLRFPEIFRKAVRRGVDAFILPANWPTARLDHWKTLIRARAIENQAYMIAVNRTGEGNGVAYPGHSMVIDPWGDVVAELGDEEGILSAEISRERVEHIRSTYPFLKDMKHV
jgi:predicted amidohydrolase